MKLNSIKIVNPNLDLFNAERTFRLMGRTPLSFTIEFTGWVTGLWNNSEEGTTEIEMVAKEQPVVRVRERRRKEK